VRALRRSLDALYWVCVAFGGTALVLISAVIPWAVYTRYVLNQAASWPESFAVLLTIVLTFFGGAACYRRQRHMKISVFVALLPSGIQRAVGFVAEALVGLVALFMALYGTKLAVTTWHNTIPEFPQLSVGLTYLPIPLGGAILLCFVLERMTLGPPPEAPADTQAMAFE
jgi:TRAP-type C4-dicarboxylate transport system permease small subunit